MRISDLQLDSDLDSIRNFYGVFIKSIFRPKACHTYWESLCISGQFRLTGNNLSTSYEALDFCWQIAVNSPQHLRPCHIFIVYVCIVYDHSTSVLNFSRARYLKRFSFISNSRLKQTDSLLQINGNVAWSNYQLLTPL